MNLPGKNVLTIGAVCLSILVGVGAYKIAQAAKSEMIKKMAQTGIVASAQYATSSPSDKLLNALEQAQLESAASTTVENPFAPSPSDTMTDQLSKSFFTSYAQTQVDDESTDGNTDGTSQDDNSLVESALANVDTSQMPRAKYSADDMTIISGNTAQDLENYANAVVSTQDQGLLVIQGNPTYYQGNLNAIGSIYASIADNLIKIPTPVTFAAEQLAIANDFYISSEDFKLISDQSKDPMKSLLALREYKDIVGNQREMYTDIEAYLKSNGILFSDTEPGHFWNSFDATSTSDTSTSADDSSSGQSIDLSAFDQ